MGTLTGSYNRYVPRKSAGRTIVSGILRLWVEIRASGC